MPTHTKDIIIYSAVKLFARNGYEGFSMRTLAKESGVGLSSIYHFFKDKDVLLNLIFDLISKRLGQERAKLPICATASEMLYQRIIFQFEHIEDVVFVLKYYLHFRKDFLRLESGYIPSKAYLHVDEALRIGIKSGEFSININDIDREAKVIAHAINGFLLEYYPDPPIGTDLQSVATSLHKFLLRSLTTKEVVM